MMSLFRSPERRLDAALRTAVVVWVAGAVAAELHRTGHVGSLVWATGAFACAGLILMAGFASDTLRRLAADQRTVRLVGAPWIPAPRASRYHWAVAAAVWPTAVLVAALMATLARPLPADVAWLHPVGVGLAGGLQVWRVVAHLRRSGFDPAFQRALAACYREPSDAGPDWEVTIDQLIGECGGTPTQFLAYRPLYPGGREAPARIEARPFPMRGESAADRGT